MNTLATTTTLGVDPFQAIDRANLAQTTSKQYKRQIELYLANGVGNFTRILYKTGILL
jgi:hypothetical protein